MAKTVQCPLYFPQTSPNGTLCCILSYMQYHSFSLPSPPLHPISSFSYIYTYTYIYDPLFLNTHAEFSRTIYVVLHNHSALTKIKNNTHHHHPNRDHCDLPAFFLQCPYNKEQNFLVPGPNLGSGLVSCHLVFLALTWNISWVFLILQDLDISEQYLGQIFVKGQRFWLGSCFSPLYLGTGMRTSVSIVLSQTLQGL